LLLLHYLIGVTHLRIKTFPINSARREISFPAADSDSFKALPEEDQVALKPFAGMQLTTGEQAMAYAQHYIGVHVKGIAGGKTYSEVSGAALAASALI